MLMHPLFATLVLLNLAKFHRSGVWRWSSFAAAPRSGASPAAADGEQRRGAPASRAAAAAPSNATQAALAEGGIVWTPAALAEFLRRFTMDNHMAPAPAASAPAAVSVSPVAGEPAPAAVRHVEPVAATSPARRYADVRQSDDERTVLRARVAELESQLRRAQDTARSAQTASDAGESATVERLRQELESRIAQAEDREAALSAELERSVKAFDSERDRAGRAEAAQREAERRAAAAESHAAELSRQLDGARSEAHRTESDLRKQLEVATGEARRQLGDLEETITALRTQVKTLTAESQHAAGAADTVSRELQRAQSGLQEKERERLHAVHSLQQLRVDMEEQRKQLRAVQSEFELAQRELRTARAQAEAAQRDLDAARMRIKELDGRCYELDSINHRLRASIGGPASPPRSSAGPTGGLQRSPPPFAVAAQTAEPRQQQQLGYKRPQYDEPSYRQQPQPPAYIDGSMRPTTGRGPSPPPRDVQPAARAPPPQQQQQHQQQQQRYEPQWQPAYDEGAPSRASRSGRVTMRAGTGILTT